MHRFIACLLATLISLGTATVASSQESNLKTLNDHFPFVVPDSVDDWNTRAESLRRRVLVATGLWPMPDKPSIRPVLHGKIEREGFTVEKVYFESLPGHYVTGMLFRPASDNQNGIVDGKRPAVLSPHGHGGRLMRLSDGDLEKQLKSGGEVFEQSGRYPKLARCAHLARMGCVTFIFDMLGYADSQQIEYQVAHRHADPRPEESDRDQPCFFSIDADLQLQSIMGLQTWNAIRALDFLSELPDVDPNRLGVTGGSGGGTQTILLGATDPRIKVGFPNGMVSTSMQGGCYCENCNYLRIDTGNVELAALFAPKPQGMTAANDWTKAMLTDGYPQLQQLYEMLGVKQNVMCGDLLKFPHNYNYITRSMMYPWMAKHLGLPDGTPLIEKDFQPFSESEMAVWNDSHPAPTETGIPHERKVLKWWKDESGKKLNSLVSNLAGDGNTTKALEDYQQVVGGAWRTIFDRDFPDKSQLKVTEVSDQVDAQGRAQGRAQKQRRYRVRHREWGTEVDVWVTRPGNGSGKQVVFEIGPNSNTTADSNQTVIGNQTIVRPVLLTSDQNQPLVDDKRSYSGFTFTYNRPLMVKRFEQILCALAAFPTGDEQELVVIGGGSGAAAGATAAAAVVAADRIDQLLLDTGGFRFASVEKYDDQNFLPGATKYLDLPGLLSLRAPNRMTLTGETDDTSALVKQVYQAVGASEAIQIR